MLQALQFENEHVCKLKLFPAPNLFTIRAAGNMSPQWDNPEEVKIRTINIFSHQRINLRRSFAIIPEHSDRIVCVDGAQEISEERPSKIFCDGLLTDSIDTPLLLRPADCLPIFMTTADWAFIGVIHAGWKGACKGIARKAVERAVKNYGVPVDKIHVGIGPSIHRCCYNNENLAKNLVKDNQWLPFITDGPLGIRIDLVGFVVKQLLDAGVNPAHITIATACTCCAKNKETGEYLFFSHHRALKDATEKEGRFMALIAF
ncbi:MAG: polyphenol oxidase family protein [bacterium]|nr:polyphenol oxidase family protein [bacterium]